jgi:peptidoglycan hydrolase-like protein with peptidoglycan-binding domain
MPQSVYCYPKSIYEYKRDDEGNLIYILQVILKNYHNKYKNYVDVQLTGVYDEQTEEAIKQFQRYSNLPVTGTLDRQTWNILNKIHNTCILYE